MRGRGSSSFSELRGNISTEFNDGYDDKGYFGGKAYATGFDEGTPYRYGYPVPSYTDEYHVHESYHTMYLPYVIPMIYHDDHSILIYKKKG